MGRPFYCFKENLGQRKGRKSLRQHCRALRRECLRSHSSSGRPGYAAAFSAQDRAILFLVPRKCSSAPQANLFPIRRISSDMNTTETVFAFVIGVFLVSGPMLRGEQPMAGSSTFAGVEGLLSSNPNGAGSQPAAAQDSAQSQQHRSDSHSAKQDMKNAGHQSMNATKSAEQGAKKGTQHTYRTSKNDTQKAAHKTENTAGGAVNGGKAEAKKPDPSFPPR